MRSFPAILVAVLALAAFPAGASAASKPAIGLSDQSASTFTDPLFAPLGLRYARYVTPWNAVSKPQPATDALDAWITAAETAGVQPLISFEHSAGDACPHRPCTKPTGAQYAAAFKAFRAKYPEITVISPWNEASHVTQPTYEHPRAAARYYRIVRRHCAGCSIVAADVLDTRNMEPWLKAFRRHAPGARRPAPGARLWGLHNYGDANRFHTTGIDTLLKTVRGNVWLTETGSITSFTTADGRQSFKPSQRRATRAMHYLFRQLVPRSGRIKRVYIYNWLSDPTNRWDSGLVADDGRQRRVYDVVKAYVASGARRR